MEHDRNRTGRIADGLQAEEQNPYTKGKFYFPHNSEDGVAAAYLSRCRDVIGRPRASLNNASRIALTARNKRASADPAARELEATDSDEGFCQLARSSFHVTHFSVYDVEKKQTQVLNNPLGLDRRTMGGWKEALANDSHNERRCCSIRGSLRGS